MKFYRILILSFILALINGQAYSAFDDNNTDYSLAKTAEFTKDQAAEGLRMTNGFVCIVQNTGGSTRPNATWQARIDQIKCGLANPDANNPKKKLFADVTLTSTRASDTSNQDVVAYFYSPPEEAGGSDSYYITNVSVNTDNRSAYDLLMDFKWIEAKADGSAFDNTTDSYGFSEVILQDNNSDGNMDTMVLTADQYALETNPITYEALGTKAVTYGPSNTQSVFVTKMYDYSSGNPVVVYYRGVTDGTEYFRETLNSSFVQTATACYDRSKQWSNVYRYGLYDNVTGAEVPLNGTFNFKYDNASGSTMEGSVGFWGAWLRGGSGDYPTTSTRLAITSEDSVSLKLRKAPGRFIKVTEQNVTLKEGEAFRIWNADDGETDIYYDSDCGTSGFSKSSSSCNAGEEFTYHANHYKAQAPFNHTVIQAGERIYSEMNRSDILVKTTGASATGVAYVQNQVLASDAPATDLDLACVGSCPKANVSITEANNGHSAYTGYCQSNDDGANKNVFSNAGQNGPSGSGCTDYTFKTYDNSSSALTLTKGGNPVIFDFNKSTSGYNSNTHYHIGGATFVLKSDLDNTSDTDCSGNPNPGAASNAFKCNNGAWRWRSGLNNWDNYFYPDYDNGSAVTIDKPIKLTYTFSTSDDVNATDFAATDLTYTLMKYNYNTNQYSIVPNETVRPSEFNGKAFVLEYEGAGNLWGLPERRTPDGYIRLVNPKSGTQVVRADNTSQGYVVKALDTGILMSLKGACTLGVGDIPATGFAAGDVPDPSSKTYPTQVWTNKPSVSTVSVVHGVEQ